MRDRVADTLAWSTTAVDLRTSAILFGLALVVYLPGIGWGLPLGIGPEWTDGWSPDGIAPLGFGEVYHAFFSETPRYSPQYPMFHYYVQVVAVAPVLVGLWLTGGIEAFSSAWPYGLTDPPSALRALTIAGRVPSALMGAGTVVVAYQVGRETWNRRAGVLGAVAVMLIAPLVFYARTSNVDVPALFWTVLGISAFVACVERGVTLPRSIAFGGLAAIAIGTKDSAYPVFLALAPVLLFLPGAGSEDRWRGLRRSGSWRPPEGRWKVLAIGAAIALVTYAFASGAAIDPERYRMHVRFLLHGPLDGYWAGVPGPGEVVGTVIDSAAQLADAVGWPLAVLSLAGVMRATGSSRRSLLLVLPAVALVAGVVVPSRFVFPRFFLVPAVVTALFAGYAVDGLLDVRARSLRRLAILAVAGALGWGVARDVDLTYAMFAETRSEAAVWLERHAVPGDCVAHTWWRSKLPRLPDGVRTLELPWRSDPIPVMAAVRPRFLIEVAASPNEETGELLIRPPLRHWLNSGIGGYELMLDLPYSGRIAGRLIPWVSPPVRIWVRRPGTEPEAGSSLCVDPTVP